MMVRDFYLEKLDRDIAKFHRKVYDFCIEKKIEPSFKNYFKYKSDAKQFLPDCFAHFIGGGFPKEFFCNSKTFAQFYYSIPRDFRSDILEESELQKFRRKTLFNPPLESMIKKKLKKDYIYN